MFKTGLSANGVSPGKTAIFAQVRDRIRQNSRHVVLDLLPDGYQLIKFKEMVLKFLGTGSLEHTIIAFWEYLLLLEICHKLLQKDRVNHTRDQRLSQPYRDLSSIYQTDEYVVEGDFSERLSTLLQHITNDYQAKYGAEMDRSLKQQEVTSSTISVLRTASQFCSTILTRDGQHMV